MEENAIQTKREITTNVNASAKNIIYVENIMFWNPGKYGKYLASIMDDSVITCDEIFEEETKKDFNGKK